MQITDKNKWMKTQLLWLKRESHGIPKVIKIHPLAAIYPLIPQNTSRPFTKKQKCQPHGGARGNIRGSPKSVEFILWGTWTSVQNFMAIHPIVVEIFHSGPKWWIDLVTLPSLEIKMFLILIFFSYYSDEASPSFPAVHMKYIISHWFLDLYFTLKGYKINKWLVFFSSSLHTSNALQHVSIAWHGSLHKGRLVVIFTDGCLMWHAVMPVESVFSSGWLLS